MLSYCGSGEPLFVKVSQSEALRHLEYDNEKPQPEEPLWISVGIGIPDKTEYSLAIYMDPLVEDISMPMPLLSTKGDMVQTSDDAEKKVVPRDLIPERSMHNSAVDESRSQAQPTIPSQSSPRNRGTTRFIFCMAPEQAQAYELVPKLIGHGGKNWKTIAIAHNAKIRLRGVGSRFKEVNGPTGKVEAKIPLQLCISCSNREGFEIVRVDIIDLLNRHAKSYAKFCKRRGFQMLDKFYFELPGGEPRFTTM